MAQGEDFAERDADWAGRFASAALRAGVRRIVYLGGLGEEETGLSDHLRSRQEVGRLLRRSGVPTIELRASILIGHGSLPFALVRALVERLPVMVTPRWVTTPTQPIGIRDALAYLVAAAAVPLAGSACWDVGGADVTTYGDVMSEYARMRHLPRWMFPVPVLTPRLSGLWLALVAPAQAKVGRHLIDGLRFPTVVRHPPPPGLFPVHAPLHVAEAIEAALAREDLELEQERRLDAPGDPPRPIVSGAWRFASRLCEERRQRLPIPAEAAFAAVRRIGGDTGWYHADWLWRGRGILDRILGGVGLRKGRAHPDEVREGSRLDFWRVERYVPGRLLRLRAEMKVPGRAWLEFEVVPDGDDGCLLRKTAVFDPHGLLGRLYWYCLVPIHDYVFDGMMRGLCRAAMAEARARGVPVDREAEPAATA
jgi:uncharacterized protein YbjT (DUF2867 family)